MGERWKQEGAWRDLLNRFLSLKPAATHGLSGLKAAARLTCGLLEETGFEVESSLQPGRPPVLVARRAPLEDHRWIGLYNHYDVEAPEKRGLTWELYEQEERLYAPGIADNLGPLAQRLTCVREVRGRGVYWLIQGEEETGSGAAHAVFPRLSLPEVAIWIEETGYFSGPSVQRVLARGLPCDSTELRAIIGEADRRGLSCEVEARFLNKVQGIPSCPYLRHIVRDGPYLAFGPNDDQSNVHRGRESLPLSTLAVTAAQFERLISADRGGAS